MRLRISGSLWLLLGGSLADLLGGFLGAVLGDLLGDVFGDLLGDYLSGLRHSECGRGCCDVGGGKVALNCYGVVR